MAKKKEKNNIKIKKVKKKKEKVKRIKDKNRKSLSRTLVYANILVLLSVVVSILVVLFIWINQDVMDEMSINIESSNKAYYQEIERLDKNLSLVAKSVSTNYLLGQYMIDGNEDGLQREVTKIIFGTGVQTIALTNENGVHTYTNNTYTEYIDEATNEAEILRALSGISSTVVSEGNDGRYLLRSGAPITNEENQIIGTVSVGYNISESSRFEDIKEVYGTDFVMFSNEGVVQSTFGKTEISVDEMITSEYKDALYVSNEQVEGIVSIAGVDYNALITPLQTDEGAQVFIATVVPLSIYIDTILEVFLQILAVAIVISFIAILIVYAFFKRRLNNPLKNVSENAELVAQGNTNVTFKKHRNDELGSVVQSFKKMIDNTKDKNAFVADLAKGNIQLENYTFEENDEVGQNLINVYNHLEDFSSDVFTNLLEVFEGDIRSFIDLNKYSGLYKNIATGINQMTDAVADFMDIIPTPIYIVNKNYEFVYVNNSMLDLLGSTRKKLYGTKCYDKLESGVCQTKNCPAYKIFEQEQKTAQAETGVDLLSEMDIVISSSPGYDADGVIRTSIQAINDETEINQAKNLLQKQADYKEMQVELLLKNLDQISKGYFDLDLTLHDYDEDTLKEYEMFKEINKRLDTSASTISKYIHEITSVLNSISEHDLEIEINEEYIGDFEAIKLSLVTIVDSLNNMIKDLYVSTDMVSTTSTDMNQESKLLSQGAIEQAASVEEISATITQVSAQVAENAKKAEQVKVIQVKNKEEALALDNEMQMMTQSMTDITQASEDIQKVLNLINDIAFQTNILSLNAAVEAARAGQHGKGFAVIAEDVRSLALKSSEAAKDSGVMLAAINKKIKLGNDIANSTAEALRDIIDTSNISSRLSSEVALASDEQASAISQITLSIDQISSVVQDTTSTARNSATLSNKLKKQSDHMLNSISSYKVKDLKMVAREIVEDEVEEVQEEEISIQLDDFVDDKYGL